MKPPSEWEATAAALQSAAEQRDFAAVEALARRFGELSRAYMAELPLPESQARMKEAASLLEWARRRTCVGRAHLAERWKRLKQAERYRPAVPEVHTWNMEA